MRVITLGIGAAMGLCLLCGPFVLKTSAQSQAVTQSEAASVTPEQARTLQRAEQWHDAAQAWRSVTAEHPENGEAVFNLGYCLHMAGRLDEAMAAHRRAATFAEYTGIATYNIACVHALQGRPAEAIDALEASRAAGFGIHLAREDADFASMRDDPRLAALLSTSAPRGVMGRLQMLAGQARTLYSVYAPQVEEDLQALLGDAETQAQSLLGRVMHDDTLGPIAARVMSWVRGSGGAAVEESSGPTSVPSLRDAQRLQQAQDWRSAAVAYGAVASREPDNAPAAFGHAYCLHMSGDHKAAITAHKRAASFKQFEGIALYNLGCAYALTGDPDAAFAALEASSRAGFDVGASMAADTDLESLRDDPRFAVLKARVTGGL